MVLFLVMAALALPLCAAMLIITATPFMGLIPMMFALFYSRGGPGRWAALPLLAALVFLGLFVFPIFFAYAAYLVVATLSLSFAFLPKRTFFHGMGIAFGALLAASLAAVTVLALMLGDPIEVFALQLESAALDPVIGGLFDFPSRMLAAVYIMTQNMSMSVGAVVEQALALERGEMVSLAVSQMEILLRSQLPNMIISSALIGGICSFSFAGWRLKRGKPGFCGLPAVEGPLVPAFCAWSLPRGVSFSMLLFLFASSVTGLFATGAVAQVAVAMYSLFSLIFAVQGASTVDFLLKRAKLGVVARIIIIAASYFLLSIVLTMIGVFEQLFHVRMGLRMRDQMDLSGKKPQDSSAWPPRADGDCQNKDVDKGEEDNL